MAERIVSPAVFTNEIDSTYLVEGISAIGGAIVGPFTKGPAYSPTVVTSINQLDALFGAPQGIYYSPYTAREYLLQQGVVTIVRTGGLEGWSNPDALAICARYVSGSLNESSDLSEGDMPDPDNPVLIGVLANTLSERGVLSNGEPGEIIPRSQLASPAETSIGFQGSHLMTRDDQQVASGYGSTQDEESGALAMYCVENEDGSKTEFTAGKLVLRQVFNAVEFASANDANSDADAVELGTYNFDINPSSPNSLQSIFGREAQKNVKPAYFTSYFESTQKEIYDHIYNHGAKYTIHTEIADEFLNFSQEDSDLEAYDGAGQGTHACRPATTPSIMSQEISGSRYELFKFVTRSFGSSSNTEVKVGIYNVKTPGTLDGTDYGTFSVVVRGFNDNDKTQDVIEDFRDVTLDPLSPRYLPRVIGDRYTFINNDGKVIERGDYVNGSNWIRVEMPKDSVAPTQCMPYGHQAYKTPFGTPSDVDGVDIFDLQEPKYNHHSQYDRVPKRYFNGAVFNEDSPDGVLVVPAWAKDTLELFAPISEEHGFAGEGYYMDNPGEVGTDVDGEFVSVSVAGIDTQPGSPAEEQDARGFRRFLVGFQGGGDGISPVQPILLGDDISAKNVQGMDCSKRSSSGSQAYTRAFRALSNQDEFDINLLVTPGLSLDLHRSTINEGVDLCETREDCFYILDVVSANGQPGKVDEAVTEASTIDSNYAATYYPWVKIIDPSTNALQEFPPSAVMPAVYAANDKTAAEWFAPAGLNRGGLEGAVSVMDRLTFAERDTLYEGKVNPIAQFPGQGIVAFGQKTLQRRASALDRINVRRLLITLKKFIASTSRYLLFEQNTAATRNKFLAIVNPYLEAVQQRQGLYAFNVIMDESNNTPDLIDRNILYGQIFLQPARAVEFIILDFNLQATGATFG